MPNSGRNIDYRPGIDPDRRINPIVCLSDDQLHKIADEAASKAMEMLEDYICKEIGRSVVKKFFWLVGVVSVAVGLWLKHHGYLQ